MTGIFLSFLNMSINASYLAVAVILLRLVLKKAPKWVSCLLWSLVGLRLIMPFSFESALSLIPSKEPVPSDIITNTVPTENSYIPLLNSTVTAVTDTVQNETDPLQTVIQIASIVWLIGIFSMLSYALFSFIRIKRKTKINIQTKKNVFLCDSIPSPFILGIFSPKIYIPSDSKEDNIQYILTHERAHIKRFDHIWKPLGFLLLSLNWFNPVLWTAYILLCRDIEGACDEKVIKELGCESKKPYSEALLDCSVKQRYISACPLAFGETGVKQRIKNVLSYKKPAVIIIIISIIITGIAAICFLSNPKDKNTEIVPDSIIIRTDFEGVYLSLSSVEVNDSNERIFNCLWHNETDYQVQFGEMYDIEYKNGDTWKSVKKEDICFNLLAYLLMPNSTQDKSYSAKYFDLSKKGTYRLICDFSVENQDDLYTSIEFTVDCSEDSLSGTDTIGNTVIKRQMTLDDVINLAKKGYELTWEDFEGFIYTEPSLSISTSTLRRSYKIDDRFFLYIIGEPDEKPEDIFINTPCGGAGKSYEIRDGKVEEFIRENENNPIINELSWGYYMSPVDKDGSNFGEMIKAGGYTEYLSHSSTRGVPVLTITSTEELTEFKNKMSDTMDFPASLTDYPSFDSVSEYFDKEFFKESNLLLVYISALPSCSYSLERMYTSDDSLCINITEIESESAEAEYQGLLMAIEIDKSIIITEAKIYAQISSAESN